MFKARECTDLYSERYDVRNDTLRIATVVIKDILVYANGSACMTFPATQHTQIVSGANAHFTRSDKKPTIHFETLESWISFFTNN